MSAARYQVYTVKTLLEDGRDIKLHICRGRPRSLFPRTCQGRVKLIFRLTQNEPIIAMADWGPQGVQGDRHQKLKLKGTRLANYTKGQSFF